MSTTFTVPRIVRDPYSETMFADLGVPLVEFGETFIDGRLVHTVTVPVDLTDADILRGRIRLMTATASAEAILVAATDALPALDALGTEATQIQAELVQIETDAAAYAAIPSPTAEQAIAATTALASAIATLCGAIDQLAGGIRQLAGDEHGLIEWIGRDALDLGH